MPWSHHLVHQHHVPHVVGSATAVEGVELAVDPGPPRLVALVRAVEQELDDVTTGDSLDSGSRLDVEHG